MKPDGETMETKEPIEAAAVAEPSSSQEELREQAPSQPEDAANDAAPGDAPNANGKPVAADSKIKPKAVVNKMQPTAKPTGVCGSHSRSGTASQRTGNDVKSSNNVSAAAGSKTTTAAKSSLAAGAIPKRPIGVAAVSSTIKNQTRMPDKKPIGQPRTTSVAPSTVTNGTKPTSVLNAAKKRPGVESVAARPKTTASTSRPTASTAPKPSTSTTAKAGAAAVLKTTRPATTPLTSRPASTSSRPTTATTKPPTSAAAKTSASRVTTASSTGWMSAAQLPKNVAAKKDISRPPSAAMTKKPATATTSAATRKPEPSKPTATVKINSASKWSTTAKAADPKVSQSKTQPPAKSTPVKKPVTTVRFPAHNKPPLVQNSPASLADKSANCTTSQAKRGTRPTQAVSPFTSTKRAGASHTTTHAVEAQSAAGAAVAAATAVTVAAERQMEATLSLPHASSFAITPGVVPEETAQNFAAASSPLQNPVRTALPQTPPPQEHLESSAALLTTPQQTTVADEPRLPPVAAPTAVTIATERQMEATLSLPHASSFATSAPEEVLAPVLAQGTTLDIVPEETAQNPAAASFPLQNPMRTALPQTPPPQEHLESSALLLTTQQQTAVADEPRLPPVASPPDLSEEPVYLLTDQTPSTSKVLPAAANGIPQIVSSTNLNEEDDEEEREGSQLISLSEMSGTTQPTEESRPGSGGPVGGSAWRAGGALLSELDSEEVSGSHQGASELSAPGVLEGTESMDDLGDGSLKGAIDMEGASAGSPDFERVPDIPVNDFEEDEDEDDDDDRVCDMDVGSERADEPQRLRHDNDVDDDEEEDEDVEMASEGVTESGLESYGNADEDDFVEDERLDNLNRVAQPPPPPPPLLPSAPAAQWDQPNPFADPWAEHFHPQQVLEHVSLPIQVEGAAAASPLKDPWQADSETPTQTQAQAWLEVGSGLLASENKQVPHQSAVKDEPQNLEVQMHRDESGTVPMQTLVPAPLSAPGMSLSSTLSSETSTPEDLGDRYQHRKFQPRASQAAALSSQPDLDYQDLGVHTKRGNGEGEEEAMDENLPADEVLRGIANAPTSNPSSSSSATEDEASDTEGEAQLDDSLESPLVCHVTFDRQPTPQRCLSTVEEGEEAEMVELEGGAGEDTTPPSATSLASYGFDTMTTASNSNAQSTGESCIKSPGIFSLEELPEETKDPCVIPQPHIEPCLSEQQYIECGKVEDESVEQVSHEGPEEAPNSSSTPSTLQQPEEHPDDNQPPYYSAICEKTENSFAGFTALLHPHRRDHTAYPRTYCDIIKPHSATVTPPKLTCADLPPRNLGQQALSPQLRRLEQHQRQLLELQQRREQQSRPLEEAEQERKRREEEEQRKKKEEAEEEIKRNKEEEQRKMQEQAEVLKEEEEEEEEKLRKEELKQREHLELQLQQQQQELMKWQPELQQCNQGQMVLLSPSSGLCTIYEALENSDEEEVADEEKIRELVPTKTEPRPDVSNKVIDYCETVTSDEDKHQDSLPSAEVLPPISDSSLTHSNPSQDRESSSPVSPEPPPPLDLDWGKKVDIVQHLINQTLLLNRDGCNSLLLLPGGAGGTLSPLESSLWPSMLPPLTPPSATVTSVSSFSPEATGSSPQGEWTVVELETHH